MGVINLSDLLLSKKFIPMYFFVAMLAIILYRYIGNSWLESMLVSSPCIIVGIVSITLNFGRKQR